MNLKRERNRETRRYYQGMSAPGVELLEMEDCGILRVNSRHI